MTRERATLDVAAIHCASELKLGQVFATGSSATNFLKDCCFNHNRQCIVKKGGGNSKTFVCPEEGCPWEVRVTKRERSGHPAEHYVSTLVDKHANMCMTNAKPSTRPIKLLPTFVACVQGDKAIKRKAIVAHVQARDHTNLQHCRDKVYRAKDDVVEEMDGEWRVSFSMIAPLLQELYCANPSSSVKLEVDHSVAIPQVLHVLFVCHLKFCFRLAMLLSRAEFRVRFLNILKPRKEFAINGSTMDLLGTSLTARGVPTQESFRLVTDFLSFPRVSDFSQQMVKEWVEKMFPPSTVPVISTPALASSPATPAPLVDSSTSPVCPPSTSPSSHQLTAQNEATVSSPELIDLSAVDSDDEECQAVRDIQHESPPRVRFDPERYTFDHIHSIERVDGQLYGLLLGRDSKIFTKKLSKRTNRTTVSSTNRKKGIKDGSDAKRVDRFNICFGILN